MVGLLAEYRLRTCLLLGRMMRWGRGKRSLLLCICRVDTLLQSLAATVAVLMIWMDLLRDLWRPAMSLSEGREKRLACQQRVSEGQPATLQAMAQHCCCSYWLDIMRCAGTEVQTYIESQQRC